MRLSTSQPDLVTALDRACFVVKTPSLAPVFECVRLAASDDKFFITGSGNEITSTAHCPAEVETGGACLVAAQPLHAFVRRLPPDQDISLVNEGGELSVISGHAKCRLGSLAPDDFPAIESDYAARSFSLKADQVKRLLGVPVVIAPANDHRPYLCGVHLHTKDGELRAVAANGTSLIRICDHAPIGAAEVPPVTIPSKTVAAILRFLDGEDVTFTVAPYRFKATLRSGGIVSATVQESYPAYESLIPEISESTPSATFQRDEALASINRTSCFSDTKERIIAVSAVDGGLAVIARGTGTKGASDRISAKITGDIPDTGFGGETLCKLLGQVEGGLVQMFFAGRNFAHVLREPDRANDQFVLMPARV